MKNILVRGAVAALVASCALSSCDDDSQVGSSITKGEVSIEVDSLFTVVGRSVRPERYDSRSADLLIGRLKAEGYGELESYFAGRLMPATSLSIPDTIKEEAVTGMNLRFIFPSSAFTGDSMAPQQLSVYKLTRQLPDDIDNATDLDGFYDPSSPLGTKSYSATAIGTTNANKTKRSVTVPLGADYARSVVRQYRKDASVFQWPATFAKYFPGIVVRSTFGRGMVANMTNTEFIAYYERKVKKTVVENGVGVSRDTIVTDSATLFAISPEVLSANLITLKPSQNILEMVAAGQQVLMSPGGYNVEIDFPAQDIINRYNSDNFNIGVINTLTYTVPVSHIENSYGINPPPYLLMVKSAKMKEFFASNSIPEEDDDEVFWAKYDKEKKEYVFSSLRPYITALMRDGGEVKPEDMRFTLVPVNITTEQAGSSYNPRTVVTACRYYIAHPTMCVLDIPASKVKFTYSRQVIK